MKTLEGKTAFITGGSTGIGLGMARVFARAGMNVVITDIRDEALTSAQQILAGITDNVLALNVDSTDLAALERAADEIERTFGALHVYSQQHGGSKLRRQGAGDAGGKVACDPRGQFLGTTSRHQDISSEDAQPRGGGPHCQYGFV